MSKLQNARDEFAQSMSQISQFWGFPRAMGAVYAAIYLAPRPINLDEIVEGVGVSKGAVSTNVRSLARLGMVHRRVEVGDRKDYYIAEPDFWNIARGILKEREKSEFDRALRSVGECLSQVEQDDAMFEDPEDARLLASRMGEMKQFFDQVDNIVALLITLDDLRPRSLVRKLKHRRSDNDDE